MRVGITGGGGFIGANLSKHLVSRGIEVSVLDNLSTGSLSNLEGTVVDFVEGSILDEAAVEKALASVDAIVHLAAVPSVPRSIKDPVTSHDVNATGTLKILEAARNRNVHVIVASSSSVYGANPVLPKTEDLRPLPVSPYAVSKLAAEAYAIAYQRCYGLPTLAFRFFNVYGPLQTPGHAYAAVVPAFVHAALLGNPLTVHGDGRQTRDFTYVGTVVATIADAVERRVSSPDPVNLAFGTRHSLLEVAGRLGDQLEREILLKHVATRPGDVRDSQADSSRLRLLFPSVLPIALDHGLSETIRWMQTLVDV